MYELFVQDAALYLDGRRRADPPPEDPLSEEEVRALQDESRHHHVTAEDVESHYQKYYGETFACRVIRTDCGPASGQRTEAEAQRRADQARADLDRARLGAGDRAGATDTEYFPLLVERWSDDPITRGRGGAMNPWRAATSGYGEGFEAVVAETPVGGAFGPVPILRGRVCVGFLVGELLERRPRPPLEQVEAQVRQQLETRLQERLTSALGVRYLLTREPEPRVPPGGLPR